MVNVFSTLVGFVVEIKSKHLPKRVITFNNEKAKELFRYYDLADGKSDFDIPALLENKGDPETKHQHMKELGGWLADQIDLPFSSWWSTWPAELSKKYK